MDVSRIEPYNPNKINWRNLTAKEILKYEKNGVEVPDIYVQWAHEFLQNIKKYDNDEVTYEKAKSISRHMSNETKTNSDTLANKNTSIENLENSKETKSKQATQENEKSTTDELQDEETAEAQVPETIDGNGTEEIQMTAAQIKHKDMTDKGVALRDIAQSFTQDSITHGQEAITESYIINEIQNSSNNEISELEGNMRELIAEAEAKHNELKNEVDKINNDKSNGSTFAKIEQLQKELERYGTDAQNQIGQTEGNLRAYNTNIVEGQEIMLNSADFGTETIDIGIELKSTTGSAWWFNIDRIIGEKAVNAGNSALLSAQQGESIAHAANTANNANIGKIPELQNEVKETTGINAKTESRENTSGKDPITGKEKESDKDIKTASNDGTDTTDKLHLSIDELVKRKVRRGEYAQEG